MLARTPRSLVVSMFTLIVLAWNATLSHAQVLPLAGYNGFFYERAFIATRVQTLPFNKDVVTPIGNMEMRAVLANAWNSTRTSHEVTLHNYLRKTLGLHDVGVNVQMANIVPGPKDTGLVMYVHPGNKTLALVHRIPGNSMKGTLSVPWNFDPSMSGTFDIEHTVFFISTGAPNAPLILQGSRLNIVNFKHGILDIAISGQAEAFGKAVLVDSGAGILARNNANSVLAPAVAATGLTGVTPGMRVANNTFNLVFELARPPLVVAR